MCRYYNKTDLVSTVEIDNSQYIPITNPDMQMEIRTRRNDKEKEGKCKVEFQGKEKKRETRDFSKERERERVTTFTNSPISFISNMTYIHPQCPCI